MTWSTPTRPPARRRAATAMLGLAALMTGLLVAPAALAQGKGQPIVGLWMIEGTPDPATGIPAFVNLATIGNDGQPVNVDPASAPRSASGRTCPARSTR